MVEKSVAAVVSKAVEKAEQSVDYSPRDGAVCPECGKRKMPIVTSRPWDGDCKIRYHRCDNKPDCLLAVMGTTVKSVQMYESNHHFRGGEKQ